MRNVFILIPILLIFTDCTPDKKSSEKKELKGNIQSFYYPFEKIDSLVVYKYNTTEIIDGEQSEFTDYYFIEKTVDGFLEITGYNDHEGRTIKTILDFDSDGVTKLERKCTLGDTKLAKFKFESPLKLMWEQNSKKHPTEEYTVKFADNWQVIKLKTKTSFTFDGFVDKKFAFGKEKRCAKIKERSYLTYYDSTGDILAEGEMYGYILNLKGVGPAYIVSDADGYFIESVLTEIVKGEKALLLQELLKK